MNPDMEWERRYLQGDTPWDKGRPAPALVKFLREKELRGRALVPGCGRGHDARALAEQAALSVVGMDISETAIQAAREIGLGEAAQGEICFIQGDFFDLPKNIKGSFDWIVEHTCFCAIDPGQRESYVQSAHAALRREGKIFAIFYMDPDTVQGPPFGVSREELGALFEALFSVEEEWVPTETFPGRENRELVCILKKKG